MARPVQRLNTLFYSESNVSDAIYRHIIVVAPLVADFRRLTAFFPTSVKSRLETIEGDPLPPITAVTRYDDDYFLNVVKDSNDGIARNQLDVAIAGLQRILRTPAQAQVRKMFHDFGC